MKTKTKPKKIEIMYLGERVGDIGGIYHTFRDAKGNRYDFSRPPKLHFGDVVHAELKGKVTSLKYRPKTIESKLDLNEKDILEFESTKLAVTQYRNNKRKAMELKQPHEDIVKAINLLKPFVRSMKLIDQYRFMKYIHNETEHKGKRK